MRVRSSGWPERRSSSRCHWYAASPNARRPAAAIAARSAVTIARATASVRTGFRATPARLRGGAVRRPWIA